MRPCQIGGNPADQAELGERLGIFDQRLLAEHPLGAAHRIELRPFGRDAAPAEHRPPLQDAAEQRDAEQRAEDRQQRRGDRAHHAGREALRALRLHPEIVRAAP